ncbi:MAG TPA: ABC transporter permease [Fimbriimonadaceae bacterium]|nr:ABC transporter permease [Fimbriimonadaceae bacterium]
MGDAFRRYAVYGLLVLVFGTMSVLAPRFLTLDNQSALLKTASLHVLPAIGFTLVLALGQLDLSFATVMTLGGMLTIGLEPRHGWIGSIAAALACGLGIGAINGLLVTKAKVNSFIATLGTLTIIQGVVNIYCGGNTLNVDDYGVYQWLDQGGLIAPPVLIAFAAAALFEVVLQRTRFGLNLQLTGGNPAAAWAAGIGTGAATVAAFALSGLLAAAGGALAAAKNISATPKMGNESLMLVIAAVIVGGTSMKGGKGSIVGSVGAVLTLCAITNGLSLLGLGQETMSIVNGAVLAVLVLAEAIATNRRERMKGQRAELLG